MADMIKSLAKVFGCCNVVILKLSKEDPRVCDYCNKRLVKPGGVVVKRAYLTDYGMMCGDCVKGIEAICIYKPGEDVSDQPWYKGSYLDEEEENSDGRRQ